MVCNFAINALAVFAAATGGVIVGALVIVAAFYAINAVLNRIEIGDHTNV